ncbi:hypothetical protein GCM10007874_57850 [Labrys miyagiensis]|uniref:Uncharacterized protein n=1 Tax=Labrys miyagiensis TaxID=346912 RepID=A0ABQ6CUU0_9HYPH|nr:hypothetical protein GCM10007874_57850 [Labrys miyagiensis]
MAVCDRHSALLEKAQVPCRSEDRHSEQGRGGRGAPGTAGVSPALGTAARAGKEKAGETPAVPASVVTVSSAAFFPYREDTHSFCTEFA